MKTTERVRRMLDSPLWTNLSRFQRDTILDLCNLCDSCENAADTFGKELMLKKPTAESDKAEIEEMRYKLECLLCHATGGKLSKSTYTLRTMEAAVTDYINDCNYETEAEIRAEAVKEFAERLHEKLSTIQTAYNARFGEMIDNFVKEFTEGEKK